MTWFERSQPLLILLSVLLGLGLAQIGDVAALADHLITPLLMGMLYAAFLPIPLRHLGRAFGNYRVTLASLAVNFVWTPLLAWGLGALFLRDAPDLRVGLLMLMVTPCTDWYLVFTGIAKGNVSLATALLPLNFVLQMVLLPVYLALFAQALVSLDLGVLAGKIATVLLIPLALALLSRYGISWLRGPTRPHQKLPQVAMVQLLCLNLAVVAIFAAEGEALLQRLDLLLWLLLPIGSFFVINFVLAQWLGRRLRLAYPEVVCLTCTTLARNSPVALAVAAAAFGDRPLIALTLVIGPLLELPIMALVAHLLLRSRPGDGLPRSRES
ncbi:arsenic resistance protein [Leptolyngbya sp. KIOST-1]|uniref:arsenic resistance protein n=1 Tax=Cyanophyceae TaxID=3028117 RepID=UPI0005624F57|nr:bile acid:sodium symporter [Leptolyngbya sp. KIOST-1]PSR18799.1 arsenic resistance protein [filamentous cyanobacterium CCP3]